MDLFEDMNLFDKKYMVQDLIKRIYESKYKFEELTGFKANAITITSQQLSILRDLYITKGQIEYMFGMKVIVDNSKDLEVFHMGEER